MVLERNNTQNMSQKSEYAHIIDKWVVCRRGIKIKKGLLNKCGQYCPRVSLLSGRVQDNVSTEQRREAKIRLW